MTRAEGVRAPSPTQAQPVDVVYIGFVTGHGGDALQMLTLARGIRDLGARVEIVVPAVKESVTFQQRCRDVGIECERSNLLTADMHGSRQRLPSLVRLFRSIDAPIVHFDTGNSCLPRSAMLALELLRYRPAFVTLQSPYETIAPRSGRARFGSRRRAAASRASCRRATTPRASNGHAAFLPISP